MTGSARRSYVGVCDDWLCEEVIRWRSQQLAPQGGCTLVFAWSNQGFFASVVLGVCLSASGLLALTSHQWHRGLQLILSALLLAKTVQQPFELTVSLTQLVAFLNCCTLSS